MRKLCNNAQVSVFEAYQNPETDYPIYHIKHKKAVQMVAAGIAEQYGDRTVKLKPIGAPISAFVPSKQGWVYESLAADPNPQIVQGGLTRTEHKPAKFEIAKGARVGHQ
jgi:hypothetical protein